MFDFISALEQTNGLLSVGDLAKMSKVSEKTIRRMVASGELPSVLWGGQRRFDPAVIQRWYIKRSPEARKLLLERE
jgi:excisionase family DNA binding protein